MHPLPAWHEWDPPSHKLARSREQIGMVSGSGYSKIAEQVGGRDEV